MFGSRILRRRSVLAIVFLCSLVYFITSISKQYSNSLADSEEVRRPISIDSINWDSELEANTANQTTKKNCRNSVQGREVIVDERGFVCRRLSLSPNGCCMRGAEGTRRFVCDTCHANGCCSIYEFCVSCCLRPEKRSLVKKSVNRVSKTFHYLFSSVTDVFDVCLAKCRTSSQSVQHENSYRNPSAKFCYGDDLPDMQLSS